MGRFGRSALANRWMKETSWERKCVRGISAQNHESTHQNHHHDVVPSNRHVSLLLVVKCSLLPTEAGVIAPCYTDHYNKGAPRTQAQKDDLQVLFGVASLLMQSYRESKKAPFGFALLDHRKAFIYVKSTRLRPVENNQKCGKQESWRHVCADPRSDWDPAGTELRQVGGRLLFTETFPLRLSSVPSHSA